MIYFLDRQITIRRLHRIDANRSAYSATATAYDASIQDPSPDKVQMFNGIIGKLYEVYVPDSSTDIRVTDKVVCNSVQYTVRAIETVDFGGNTFLTLIVEKDGE